MVRFVRNQPTKCGRDVTHPVPRPTIADGRDGNKGISKQLDTACGGAPKLRVVEPGDRLHIEEWRLLGRETLCSRLSREGGLREEEEHRHEESAEGARSKPGGKCVGNESRKAPEQRSEKESWDNLAS